MISNEKLENLIKEKNFYLFVLLKNIEGVDFEFHSEYNNSKSIIIRVYFTKIKNKDLGYLIKKEHVEFHEEIGYSYSKNKKFFDLIIHNIQI